MGLDNGIILRVKGKINPDAAILKIPGIEETDWNGGIPEPGFTYYDICYWRKCPNIRNILLESTEESPQNSENGYFIMSADDIRYFFNELITLLENGPDNWEDKGSCFWSFEDMVPNLAWDLVRLGALMRFVKGEGAGKCEVRFYDSY